MTNEEQLSPNVNKEVNRLTLYTVQHVCQCVNNVLLLNKDAHKPHTPAEKVWFLARLAAQVVRLHRLMKSV